MVRPKKHLGQHFLKENDIAHRIVEALQLKGYSHVLEIGPGTGVLTQFLVKKPMGLSVIELDRESIEFLKQTYANEEVEIIYGDVLKYDLHKITPDKLGVIGNFPYNISSQIFFKVWDNRHRVEEVVCMLQKEVAERIASGPGSKKYGILSVLLQAFYDIDYLFTVKPESFIPPPKVQSGVIRLVRNGVTDLGCDEHVFKNIVKTAFQKRRKTLRNALKTLNLPPSLASEEIMNKRAEQLEVREFVELTQKIEGGYDS